MFSWLKRRRSVSQYTHQAPLPPVVIFHHIAKTGGTSLRKVVQANYRGKKLLELYGPGRGSVQWYDNYYHSLSKRRKAEIQCIAAHSAHYLIPIIDRPFQVFTLLRDPVERVISLYYFTKILVRKNKGRGAEIGLELKKLGWELEDIFVNIGLKGGGSEEQRMLFAPFFNGQSRAILKPHVDVGFALMVQGVPTQVEPLQTQLREIVQAHYIVGVTEQYETSVHYFAQIFGWHRVFFEYRNKTKKRPRQDDFTSDVLDLIRSFNQVDAVLHNQAREELAGLIERPAR